MVADLLSELIEIPSQSGEEADIASFLTSYLEANGFETTMLGDNVVTSIGSGPVQLVFNAHIDTVAPDGDWSTDPYTATVEDGRVYGLGASDNKASVAALLEALQELQDAEIDGQIAATFVANEEVDGSGTQTVLDWLQQHKDCSNAAAIVTEPTGLAWIATGCRGTCFIELELEAAGGHASQAIHNPLNDMQTIEETVTEALTSGQDPAPSVTLTQVEAGGSINAVPSTVTAGFDVRTVPGLEASQVLDAFREAAEDVEADVDVSFADDPCPPAQCSDQGFVETVQAASGIEATRMSPASNDSCFFNQQGIPAVVLGPGTRDAIHQPDEFVETEKVKKAVETFTSIATAWCE